MHRLYVMRKLAPLVIIGIAAALAARFLDKQNPKPTGQKWTPADL